MSAGGERAMIATVQWWAGRASRVAGEARDEYLNKLLRVSKEEGAVGLLAAKLIGECGDLTLRVRGEDGEVVVTKAVRHTLVESSVYFQTLLVRGNS
jgi:hypothetical protein